LAAAKKVFFMGLRQKGALWPKLQKLFRPIGFFKATLIFGRLKGLAARRPKISVLALGGKKARFRPSSTSLSSVFLGIS
jgi:hypothetical protein